MVGVVYGTLVYTIANYRGKKNDSLNHMFASTLSMPIFSAFVKSNLINYILSILYICFNN
jgi:hypothetical protein